MIKGMDLSTLAEVERCGGRFYDKGRPGDAMDILIKYGMNMVRLRLWNDPFDEAGHSYGAGGNDIETVLALARRAKEKGCSWLLDFHYSDFWADPGKQTTPKAWRKLDAEGLEHAVYEYTASVLQRCREEDLLPAIAAIGNELTNGLLWPYGKVPEYGNIARFVSAGIRAVGDINAAICRERPDIQRPAEISDADRRRESAKVPEEAAEVRNQAFPAVRTMIHLDNGGNRELYRGWFSRYFENGGLDFDYIGLSYYPFWHGTPDMLRANLEELAERFGKKMFVAEVSMGYTLQDYQSYEKLDDKQRNGMAATPELSARVGYPMTPFGQARFMKDIMEIIRDVPDGLGAGFCYWEPAWIPVPGSEWATEQGRAYVGETNRAGGNEWANQALFDYDGNVLPALEVIRDFEG